MELFEAYRVALAAGAQRSGEPGPVNGGQEGTEYPSTGEEPDLPEFDPECPSGQLVRGAYEKHRDYGPARVGAAKRQELASRIEAATEEYNRRPEVSSALQLAGLYNEMRSFDRALYFSRKAVEQDPGCREGRLLRTELFRRFGMGRKLQEEWRALLALEPGNAEWQRRRQADEARFGDCHGLGDGPVVATVSLPDRKLPAW